MIIGDPQVLGFDWDHGNEDKNLRKHGLGREAIEAFLHGTVSVSVDRKHSGHETRFLAVGKDAEGRWLLASFTFRQREDGRYLRPISARRMHQKEVRAYAEAEEEPGG